MDPSYDTLFRPVIAEATQNSQDIVHFSFFFFLAKCTFLNPKGLTNDYLCTLFRSQRLSVGKSNLNFPNMKFYIFFFLISLIQWFHLYARTNS